MGHLLTIYDCDGTLIDSETIAMQVCAAAARSIGLDYTPETFGRRFIGIPGKDTWAAIEVEYGRPLPDGFREATDGEIKRRFLTEIRPVPGVRAAVEEIGGRRCVASSTGLHSLRRNIRTAGLEDLFDPHIFSASQVARGKPAPDVFLFAASQMGVDPIHCLVIEDSVPGVTAARRAGMQVIGFTGVSHERAHTRERLLAAGALAVADDMADLPDLLRRHAVPDRSAA